MRSAPWPGRPASRTTTFRALRVTPKPSSRDCTTATQSYTGCDRRTSNEQAHVRLQLRGHALRRGRAQPAALRPGSAAGAAAGAGGRGRVNGSVLVKEGDLSAPGRALPFRAISLQRDLAQKICNAVGPPSAMILRARLQWRPPAHRPIAGHGTGSGFSHTRSLDAR